MNLRDTGRILALATLLVLPLSARAQWTAPTPEELSMTSQAEAPGAAAVLLYKEETTDDDNHNHSTYVRLKVLNDKGKEYANVELPPYVAGGDADTKISEIVGRTIHPDGTIITFTGKPFDKLIEKSSDTKVMSKVFSLPDVQVGSIIEYRYKLRYEDNYYISPDWYIQSELFLRKGHYQWKPTQRELANDKGVISSLAWFPVLPPGVTVKVVTSPTGNKTLSVDVANVPAKSTEDFLPPTSNLTDRVLFYYSPYRTSDEYWASEGKDWSKRRDKFIGPGPAVKQAVQQLILPTDQPMDKLKKIYAACMQIENTVLTRTHSQAEERAQGVKEIHSTDDVLTRKRGGDDQIAELFIAMARAAGFKAYAAGITSRERNVFVRSYLSLSQIDDIVAIVNVDGKELFFDPGQRYSPFQHMAWKHTMVEGIRQLDKGTGFVVTPAEPYTASNVQRLADLTLDKEGVASGNVQTNYTGPYALYWRQQALRGDRTSLDHDLVEDMQKKFGTSMDVKVTKIDNLTEYEQPLRISFTVKGPIASSAGRRTLVVSDIFEALQHPTFPTKERKEGVFFRYGHMDNDVVRIHYPSDYTVESIPKDEIVPFQKFAVYHYKAEQAPGYYTIRRDFSIGEIIFKNEEYQQLRDFYTTFETKDHEPVVMKPSATPTAAKPGN